MRLQTERRLTYSLFLLGPLVLFVTFYIYPIANSFKLSFHEWNGITAAMPYVGFDNYRQLFADHRFYESLANNAKWLVFYLTVPTLLGFLLALLVNTKVKWQAFFRTVFFLPYALTPVAVAAIWRWIYDPGYGLLNYLLSGMGLKHLTRAWLGDPELATYAIMGAALWWTTGFVFMLYFVGLRNVPEELVEASKIDGANFLQSLTHVTVPMLLPSTLVVLALNGASAMKVFDIIYSLTGGGPGYATEVLATQMYDVSFNRLQMGLGSAVSVVLLLISAVLIMPYIAHATARLEGIEQ